MQNWAGSYTFQADRVERPTSTAGVARVVAAAPHVRALGTRHSFNDIADSPGGVLMSLEKMDRVLSLDPTPGRPTVTIEPGVTYGRLGPALHAAGWALPNLASLPHISVAGATATATHGSGEGLGCLSTSVAALELVTAGGDVRTLQRGDADFDAAVVHLGALGVVTSLTLDLVPAFDVGQFVYTGVPFDAFTMNLDAIAASAYSVSGFTDWQRGVVDQVWMKCVAGRPHLDLTALGGTPADRQLHPLDGRPGNLASDGAGAAACTAQLGVAGPWYDRLPHFRNEFTPSSGEELQSEFFVPREHAAAAVAAVSQLRQPIGELLQVTEFRLIAADALWLSPFYRRPTFAIHFTWRRDRRGVDALLPRIEAALARFDARPHWGKLFTTGGDRLATLCPKHAAFADLRRRYDPSGKFLNPYLARVGLGPRPDLAHST